MNRFLSSVFFQPDLDFVEWLVSYAEGRIILEIGSGSGHLLRELNKNGGKAWGIEPNYDFITMSQREIRSGQRITQVMVRYVEECAKILEALKPENTLIIFARPCHGHFVENSMDMIPRGIECLYITIQRNLDLYDDMGRYRDHAKEIDHGGTSADNEVVYSVTLPQTIPIRKHETFNRSQFIDSMYMDLETVERMEE